MKLRDLFDISMADFYEIHSGYLVYKIKKDKINAFIQVYRVTVDADVRFITPMLKKSIEQDFLFEIGFEVYIN